MICPHKFIFTNISFFFLILGVFFPETLLAQSNGNRQYWQQELDYQIEVTLDDVNHQLNGYLLLDYKNNSLDTLNFIYFHLWPNAFKNTETAFAQQKRKDGSLRFHYVLPSELGWIDKMDFKVEGKSAFLISDEKHVDIGKLVLNEPLLPGQTIQIETPFQVKIPKSFSRLGHVEQSYQITQWYPKPAVYDHKGWHPIPYLDQGEFYSEFGSFDVKISLPKNYVVGATGDLQTESEIQFLDKIAQKTAKIDSFGTDLSFPPSSDEFKTLHYKQSNVHDFAWFADKRFHVLKEVFTLPETGEEKTAWAMFTNQEAELWKKGANYVKEALIFYSEKVGAYPYKQATAVQSALSAGAGMEYPNVTVIGVSGSDYFLEEVIVHEVGHNWFYGQLASNERVHPWMDEGMNTYYEERYFKEKYKGESLIENLIPIGVLSFFGFEGLSDRDYAEKQLQSSARVQLDQAIENHSTDFTSRNYGNCTYTKAGLAMDYLEHYLGTKKMDQIMKDYYKTWEYKHPYPEDFKAVIENNTGRPIDWFFDELLTTTKNVDYWLYKYAPQSEVIGTDTFDMILVRNHPNENVAGPFPITAVKDEKPVKTIWYDGFHGQETVLFPSIDFDELVIDYYHHLPEYDRQNNRLKNERKLKVAIFPKVENNQHRQLFTTPIIGFNEYDKLMLGAAFYNSIGPLRDFQFTIAPMFGLESKELTGLAQLEYTKYLKNKWINKAEFALNVRRFSYSSVTDRTTLETNYLTFLRVAPEIKVHLRQPLTSSKSAFLRYRFIWLAGEKSPDNFSKPLNYIERETINELTFEYKNKVTLTPHSLNIRLVEGKDYHNEDVYGYVEGTAKLRLLYSRDRRSIDFRLFGGAFIGNKLLGVDSAPDGLLANPKTIGLFGHGEYDFTYQDFWLERGASSDPGFLGKQIYDRGGGFKLLDFRGESQKWLAALNLETDIPFIPKSDPIFRLRFFADIGISADERSFYRQEKRFKFKDDFLTDAGLALSMFDENIKIYWTIWYSEVFDKAKERKFADKISFFINMPNLNPIKAVRKVGTQL